jgi:acetyl esterase/lipase
MDIAYTLWPEGDIPLMVSEVKQAVVWMKENADQFDVDPERVVLMGGSAGGHLALLAAYTAGHPALPSLSGRGDASVRGVIAFYPPVCFPELQELRHDINLRREDGLRASLNERVTNALLGRLLATQDGDSECESTYRDFLPALLGGDPGEESGPYEVLSPIFHVGAHCPPALLLQGTDDIFVLAPAVRRTHRKLLQACAGSILVEFPYTEHAFDLVLPRVSPVAQAATYDVERFLALLM